MIKVRYLKACDKQFWYRYDDDLPEAEFLKKVRDKRGYLLLWDGDPIGLLRYELFWDHIPFCTMLVIDEKHRGKGCGRQLMNRWEQDMKMQGHGMLLTSTRADETAQHFYRKLGYRDCGGLLLDVPGYAQPMELFFQKPIL